MATAMKWKDEYSVGIPLIDSEHQQLFEEINKLYMSMKRGVSVREMEDLLGFVINYAKTHFADEEKIMQEKGYPEYPEQKKQHENYLLEMQKMQEAFNESVEANINFKDIIERLFPYLCHWWENHILELDKKIGEFVRQT